MDSIFVRISVSSIRSNKGQGSDTQYPGSIYCRIFVT